jgi:hypothetical protein
MCSLRVFKFEEINPTEQKSGVDLSDYVRKDELQNLITGMLGGSRNEQTVSADKSNTSLAVITE